MFFPACQKNRVSMFPQPAGQTIWQAILPDHFKVMIPCDVFYPYPEAVNTCTGGTAPMSA